MSQLFKDKVVVVTGGSKGIGRAFAQAFLNQGAHVISVARSKNENPNILSLCCDVSGADQVKQTFKTIYEKFGHVDVLINCAGTQGEIGAVMNSNPEDWTRAIHVNLFGTYYCVQCVLPDMIQKKCGRIINMSGGGAAGSRTYFASYAASKAAVVRFTETLAKEIEKHGITVNAVAPGAINTQMLDEVLAAKDWVSDAVYQEAVKQKQTGGHSLDKGIELVLFLASDQSQGISGRLISAQHDDWKNMKSKDSDWFTLRRVDPYLFTLKR